MALLDHWVWMVVCPILAYMIGSIPFSYIIAKWRSGVDIRKSGNQNVGGLNVMISSGYKWGIVAGALDFYKGLFTLLAALIIPFSNTPVFGEGTYWELTPHNIIYSLVAMAIVLGHNYPVYLKFKGGRGMAVTVSFLVIHNPLILLVFVISAGLFIYLLKHVRPGLFLAIFVGTPVAFFLRLFPPWIVLTNMDSTFLSGLFVLGIALALFPKYVRSFIDMFKGKEYKIGKTGGVILTEESQPTQSESQS